MKNVNKLIWVICIFVTGFASAQNSSDKLKKEQERLESKIANTKMLLKKSQDNTSSSLNELKIIENQIQFREALLKNYDNQIRSAELKVENKEKQIEEYRAKIERLKAQYKKLVLYAYKNRNKYGKMMFIFASRSYYEAIKRNAYLKRISEIQRNQFITIQQHQSLIQEEIGAIEEEKQQKMAVIQEKKAERAAIEEDRIAQEKIYKEFKQEEDEILAKLKQEERERRILQDRIAEAIRKEIAEAEARRKAEEAARKKAAASTGGTAATETASPTFTATKEATALSKNFEGNRGKLPWPVDKGSITEKFGNNPHPTLKNVTTNNRGIDISTPKNAQVRAVFEGEVTSVLNIPGAGKVVIIKHGNYRTVYSNLQDTYVTAGQKVTTKKVIGSLLTKPGQNVSIAHFEIHKVSGSTVTCLNPSLWVTH